MFLLDTNVVSELRRPERAHANVRSWAQGVPSDLFAICAVSVFELERGALLIERRDLLQGAVLRRWLDHEVLRAMHGRIYPIDVTIAREAVRLHIPDPRPERDALIAATALVHGLTVVTRNTADFVPMGVALLNPWFKTGHG